MKKKTGFIAEFREFISRGSVVDLAVGVIIGSAFTAIVNSLVGDLVMPFIGWLLGDMDLSQYKLVLSPAVGDVPENAILYGSFIQSIINFLLIALVVFLIVRAINRLHRKKEEEAPAEPPAPSPEASLLAEIRDLLKKEAGDNTENKQ